jgi:hypothetical protein
LHYMLLQGPRTIPLAHVFPSGTLQQLLLDFHSPEVCSKRSWGTHASMHAQELMHAVAVCPSFKRACLNDVDELASYGGWGHQVCL